MSIFRQLRRREREDLITAVKGNKYWKATSSNKDFIYVIALTRARVRTNEGFRARVTFLREAIMPRDVAKFCRRYRVLLVNRRTSIASCVITWKAFLRIIRNYSEDIYRMLTVDGGLPPYINIRVLNEVFKMNRSARDSLLSRS